MSARHEPRSFSLASSRIVSTDSSRARSMEAHVLTMRHSASSARSASLNPASVSIPSINSESTWFFGQPRVVRWTFIVGSQYTVARQILWSHARRQLVWKDDGQAQAPSGNTLSATSPLGHCRARRRPWTVSRPQQLRDVLRDRRLDRDRRHDPRLAHPERRPPDAPGPDGGVGALRAGRAARAQSDVAIEFTSLRFENAETWAALRPEETRRVRSAGAISRAGG